MPLLVTHLPLVKGSVDNKHYGQLMIVVKDKDEDAGVILLQLK